MKKFRFLSPEEKQLRAKYFPPKEKEERKEGKGGGYVPTDPGYADKKNMNGREKRKNPLSPDLYTESFSSQERTVNMNVDGLETATSTVYSAVGKRKQEFNISDDLQGLLSKRASPFEGRLFDAVNSMNSNLAPRFDVLGGTVVHNYLGVSFDTLQPNFLRRKYVGIQNERNSLVNSYQYYNLNINQWVIVPVVGRENIEAEFGTALNAFFPIYQIILRKMVKILSQYSLLIHFESVIKRMEFNFFYPVAEKVFAELRRSTTRGAFKALANFISNEFLDVENFNLEIVPLTVPSRETDGMDSPLIQFDITENIPPISLAPSEGGNVFDFSVAYAGLDDVDLTIPNLLSYIRQDRADEFKTTLASWITTIQNHTADFPRSFSEFRSALETYARSGLINWTKGFDVQVLDLQGEFSNWGLINDIVSTNMEGTAFSDNSIDETTSMLKARCVWSDTYGIARIMKEEQYYPYLWKSSSLAANLHTSTPFGWEYFRSLNLYALSRLGVAILIDRIETATNTDGGAAPMRMLNNGTYDTTAVRVPSNLYNPVFNQLPYRVEFKRLMGKLFHYGKVRYVDADSGVTDFVSEDYVMPVPVQIYSPSANVDRYLRKFSVYKQFVR